jgi:hypothetical protein
VLGQVNTIGINAVGQPPITGDEKNYATPVTYRSGLFRKVIPIICPIVAEDESPTTGNRRGDRNGVWKAVLIGHHQDRRQETFVLPLPLC